MPAALANMLATFSSGWFGDVPLPFTPTRNRAPQCALCRMPPAAHRTELMLSWSDLAPQQPFDLGGFRPPAAVDHPVAAPAPFERHHQPGCAALPRRDMSRAEGAAPTEAVASPLLDRIESGFQISEP